jgi:hypothetical protein
MITSSNYANDEVFSLGADTSCNRGRNPVESPRDNFHASFSWAFVETTGISYGYVDLDS